MIGPVEQSILDAYQQDEDKRAERIHQAWCAYHGDHAQSLEVRDGEADDNVTLNLSRLVADAAVQALYGQEPAWTTDDERLDGELDGWMRKRPGRASPFLLTLQKLALNGAVAGHAWRKWSVRAGAPPRLLVLDPANVWAYWDPDDHETAYAYKIEWRTVNEKGRATTRRQLIERATDTSWTIRDQERIDGFGRWADVSVEVWPYAWPPIAGAQNLPCPNEHYGIADLERDALSLQASINYAASNMAKVLRLYAHPRDVAYGVAARELSMAPGEILCLPSTDARIETLTRVSDLTGSLDYFGRLREAMHAVTRTPEVAIGKMGDVGAMSGVALSILYGPLVAKTEQKRLTYGPLVEDALREYLVLTGAVGSVDDVEVETTWPSIVPVDAEAERRAALVDEQLGVSKATVLEALGYDADLEAERRADEAATAVDAAQAAFDAGHTVDAATSQPPMTA